MEITVEQLDKSKVELPKILYKYRQWDNHLHRSLLLQRQIYLAPPSTFEDQYEFKNFKRYDLMNQDEVYELCMRHSIIRNPTFNDLEHDIYVRDWVQRVPFNDAKHLHDHQQQHYKDYDQRVGVLCLTGYRDTLKMWNDYANDGNGFCVGIDYKMIDEALRPHSSGGIVNYCDELPMIHGLAGYTEETILRTFYKLRRWEYEKEYRTTIFKPNPLSIGDRVISLPRESIKEVIIGWGMSPKEVAKLISICKNNKLDVELLQAYRSNDPVVEIRKL